MHNNRSYKNKVFLVAGLGLALFFSHQSYAKEYYKWVDSKGSTHYTATPPPKSAKNKGKIDTYGYYAPSAPQSNSAPSQQTNSAQTNSNTSAAPMPTNAAHDQQQREANAALQRGAVERAAEPQ